jgi:UTP--glucose-1-phosphate uridylyltransferase
MKNAVIPVAGLGTRLLPATKSQPKEMLPVGRKPVVQYIVEELIRVGVKDILFITGSGKTSIENHFDVNINLSKYCVKRVRKNSLRNSNLSGCVCVTITPGKDSCSVWPCSAVFAIFCWKRTFYRGPGRLHYWLNAQSNVVQRMEDCFEQYDCEAVIAFEEVPAHEVDQYGIAVPKTNEDAFEVLDIIEKPSVDEAPSNLAVAARYILTPKIYDALDHIEPGKGGEIQLTDAIKRLIVEGKKSMVSVWGTTNAGMILVTLNRTFGHLWNLL